METNFDSFMTELACNFLSAPKNRVEDYQWSQVDPDDRAYAYFLYNRTKDGSEYIGDLLSESDSTDLEDLAFKLLGCSKNEEAIEILEDIRQVIFDTVDTESYDHFDDLLREYIQDIQLGDDS